MLANHGWSISTVERDDVEWWADEIWELHSTWSPTTARAWLVFLVDPQFVGERQAGAGVWAIDLHARSPDHIGHALTGIRISDLRRTNIMHGFLAKLDTLRTAD
jgi:hypothetical protein